VRRLPALRDGFEVLSPSSRQRLLDVLSERFDMRTRDFELQDDPLDLARFGRADAYGRIALAREWRET
jgi:hypothetical protein